MSKQPSLYIWDNEWSLPDGFKTKREFRMYLGKNEFVVMTNEHYSKKNNWHCDILKYAVNGQINKKLHCKSSDGFGKRFIQCIQQLDF